MMFGLFGSDEKPKLGYYSQNDEDAEENSKLLAQKKQVLNRFEILNQKLKSQSTARPGLQTTQGEEGLWIGG